MADGFEEEASGQKTQNWGIMRPIFLLKYGPMKKSAISDGKKAQYMGKHRRKTQ